MTIKELESLNGQYSALVITPVEKMQDISNRIIKSFAKKSNKGVYIALNKPHDSIEKVLQGMKINTGGIHFIDCIRTIAEDSPGERVAHIQNPSDITSMNIALNQFMEKIEGEKYIVLDSLTTLLIYNKENLVIMFVKALIDEARKYEAKMIILTPEPRGGELINKVALFFDKVIRI
ncbi:MAG: hypothetical protein JW754_04915 [Candidatus Aenigmarchaeota archaeon]|nr:hypothetical protein [Candidatus Aenigmarchaeota archaeon]